jgi:hypothetical protein
VLKLYREYSKDSDFMLSDRPLKTPLQYSRAVILAQAGIFWINAPEDPGAGRDDDKEGF